jgi:sulfate permease, SulP family
MSIDSSAWGQIDLSSSDAIKGLVKELRGEGIALYFTDVHAPVLEFSRQTGLLELIGEDRVFPTVDAAVRRIETYQNGNQATSQ